MKIPQPLRNSTDVYLNSFIILLVFSSVRYFLTFVTADPDLWGHIKFGKDIWNAEAIPGVDIYSYTAYGRQWINHEWLSEVMMYLIFNILGSPGLLAGKTLVCFYIILLLLKIRSRTSYALLLIGVSLLIVFQITSFIDKIIKTKANIVVDPDRYPVQAIKFLKDNNINGKIMVPFDWGAYAIWHLYPKSTVSVDGRFRTVSPESVLEDHLTAMYHSSSFLDMADKYKSEIIFIKNNQKAKGIIPRIRKMKHKNNSDQANFYFS